MANYCFTQYAVEGSKDVLEKICNAINAGEGLTEKSIENLGLDTAELEEEYEYWYRAEWEEGAHVDEIGGKSVLFFTEAYPWMKADIIDAVLNMLGEKESRIYYLAECFEEEVHYTNDAEGKYFPERFYVDTYNDDEEMYFKTKEEALAHIRESYELPDDFDTFEKIEAYCDENDLTCELDSIEVRAEEWSTSEKEQFLKFIFDNATISTEQ